MWLVLAVNEISTHIFVSSIIKCMIYLVCNAKILSIYVCLCYIQFLNANRVTALCFGSTYLVTATFSINPPPPAPVCEWTCCKTGHQAT